ncbi:MAG: DUF3482 domain-containing protein [Nevskiaceae bacterium]|nr:MAG: DUF3482 domain-containing protein [Nevskiaceae bacterium]TBR73122.1 MAG: DUF3482 domain-containing protein [Nevskiaceae bacterium]
MNALPRFAVVGHPNKGKSSIVATLTQNAAIAIAMEPGTTRDSRSYTLRVDDTPIYELIDTPGFQRPRQALAWLEAHSTSASDRPGTVRAFITQHRDDARFHDECELLAPVVGGAGILYVVDGSVPYSSENEAEMEILRWTGQPRLALINAIDTTADYSDTWQTALGQYFSIVRRFDAVRAPFAEHLGLLRSFAELMPAWREPLESAIHHLEEQRRYRWQRTQQLIATALADMLTHRERVALHDDSARSAVSAQLQARWRDWQRHREQRLRTDVEQLYRHAGLQRKEPLLNWELDREGEDDLFSEHTRHLWGVNRRYLASAGFGAGALGGAGLDAITVGHSLGAGALIGGVLGAAGSVYYANRLDRIALGPFSPGGRDLHFGPVHDPQFGYVVLGRALEHAWHVANRNHATRGALAVVDAGTGWLQQLGVTQRARLQRTLSRPPRDGTDTRRRQALENAVGAAAEAFERWHALPQGSLPGSQHSPSASES